MRTTFVWMLLAGLACAAPAPKVDPESWVGRTVLIELDPVRFYPELPNAPDAAKGGVLAHIDYRVLAERGDFVQVHEYGRSVWVAKADLLRLADAERWFGHGTAQNPTNPRYHAYRAWAHKLNGNFRAALEDLDRAVGLDPSDSAWLNNRGVVRRDLKQYPEAVADFTSALKLRPGDSLSLRNRADAHRDLGEYAKAGTDYRDATKSNPHDAVIHNNYGWMLATCPDEKVRDGKAAMQLARVALEKIGTPTAVIMDTVAAAHAELGEFAKAAEA